MKKNHPMTIHRSAFETMDNVKPEIVPSFRPAFTLKVEAV